MFPSAVVSTLQGGCFVACFITPWITDRYGRRWCLFAVGIITSIGVIMQAASSATGNFAAMFVGRFVAGLGVGAASMLTPLYVSECAPRAVRGGLTCKYQSIFTPRCLCRFANTSILALYQLFIVTGTMLAFWYVQGAVPHHFVFVPQYRSFPVISFLSSVVVSTPPPKNSLWFSFFLLVVVFRPMPSYPAILALHITTPHWLSHKTKRHEYLASASLT